MSEKKTYEDYSEFIDEAIRKQRSRWRLDAIKWFDFEDVEQVVKSHVAQKWYMWDQSRPLGPWLGRVITNRMWNLIRGHYGSYIKPCSTCIHARDESCAKTQSGNQDVSCSDFARWTKKKKYGLELKTAGSLEEYDGLARVQCPNSFDYDYHLDKLDVEMEKRLSKKKYRAYRMIFFEEYLEEEVANFMGYKCTDSNKKLGYRQVKNLKNEFQKLATAILNDKTKR
tara:strand:+ start:301 stop:978 length:678 start_codon:yes stop_codon:yes gene_type:complete